MDAMILAAGRGERMRPLTDTTPKPLLEAGGRSLIEWQLQRLRAAGIANVVINHAHLGEQIEARLGDGAAYGMRIRYSPEARALETAGGIRQALPLFTGDVFVVVNGDVFCDIDLAPLVARARQLDAQGDLAHLVLVPNPTHNLEGDFACSNKRARATGPRYTFAGIGAYHAALFATLQPGQPARLGPLLHDAIARERVSATVHPGYWLDVGTPERLAELDQHLRPACDT